MQIYIYNSYVLYFPLPDVLDYEKSVLISQSIKTINLHDFVCLQAFPYSY